MAFGTNDGQTTSFTHFWAKLNVGTTTSHVGGNSYRSFVPCFGYNFSFALVKFGIQHNPNEWHLYYDLGFIYYMELKEYDAAADAFRKGSTLPKAHPFMTVMAATMATHAGDIEMARMMWRTTYESGNVERSVKANAVAHLRALQVDEDVMNLEKAAAAYKSRTGQFPTSFSELRSAGLATGLYPTDPLGYPYKLLSDGRVEVARPDELPFITKGTPPGYTPPPPKFLPTD